MKKIVSFLIICFLFLSVKAQYPISQNIGAPTTLVVAKGGLKADSTFIVPTFTDTSKANLSNYIKVYPGALIRVQDTLYMRNKTATKWEAVNASGAASTLQQVLNSGNLAQQANGEYQLQLIDNLGNQVLLNPSSTILNTVAGDESFSMSHTGYNLVSNGNSIVNAYPNDFGGVLDISNIYGNRISLKAGVSYASPSIEWYSNIDNFTQNLRSQSSTGTSEVYMPNVNPVDTLATLSDLRNNTPTIPTLQQVTDAGNTTDNSITVGNALQIYQTSSPFNTGQIGTDNLTDNRNYQLPDASGTFALSVNGTPADGNGDVTIPVGITHGTASGTDTYAVTISGAAYSDGNSYLVRFTNGNTTGATLNINGLGAKTLYRNNDGPLIGGDIVSGAEMLCVYNSTLNGFQTIGVAPNTLIAYVTNVEATTITKGQVVYAFGGTGDRMTVKLAKNSGDSTSAQTVGVVLSSSIAANQKGFIIVQGLLDGLSILPTSTFADGDPLYLGATAGSITKVKPSAPQHLVYLGNVTTASPGASGRWYVRVQNGYELEELHNVAISSPQNNQVLAYSDTQKLWKNRNIYSIVDTTTTIATKSNLALKLNISDTATMLSPYVNTAGYGLSKSSQTLSADTSKLSTLYQTNLRVKYTDTASMLLPYLRKIDTTNKFVNTITRTVGKDSIIFYIGGTRYAIKDSVGGGGGSAAGSTGYVQYNSGGSFAADSSHFWDNTNKRLGLGTTTPSHKFDIKAGSLTNGVYASNITATLPTSPTADAYGTKVSITTTGSALQTQAASRIELLPGWVANYDSYGVYCSNNVAGIGTTYHNSTCNMGGYFNCGGTTIGTNVGNNGIASNGNKNIGIFGKSVTAKNSATNVGVVGMGNNTGTSPIQVGGYFTLDYSDPSFTSAALMCDNGGQANDIFVARDNGSPIFKVFDGGNTFIGNSPTDAGYKLDVNGTARVSGTVTFPNGALSTGGVSSSTQIQSAGAAFTTVTQYKLTNAGGNVTPKGIFGGGNSAGVICFGMDETNGITLIGANNANNRIARAGINITNLVNTNASESADMIFLTQSGGTAMSEKMRITSGGGITYTATNTAAGTTGNQTINKPSGTVNIAAAGTSITVTNSLVTTSSIVFATIRTNDATAVIKNVVPSSGSFTINLNAAATAETSIGFFVIN